MTPENEFVVRALLIGIGATLVLDLWVIFAKHVLRIPASDLGLLGRWVGHMPRGRFTHESIANAAPVPGERPLGWLVHYAIGIVFAALLIAITGLDWARQPTLLPPLVFGVVTVLIPFLVLQPALGAGVAAAKTPNPNSARLRSLMSHTVFGIGMYVSAVLLARSLQ